jgi:GDP-L-fucose synthase
MKSVLITGGNGYIAKSLHSSLSTQYRVTSITRNDFDLTDYSKTCSWFEGKRFDSVIHTAISGGSRLRHDNEIVFNNNMSMFTNLLANKNCFSKLISFGSGAEIFHGDTPYASSKREIAKQILDLPNFYNLRIFGVFDYNELETRFIKSNIIRYIRREPMIIHSNKIMDFFYMPDLISLVEYYIKKDNLEKEINCSYTEKYSLKHIVNIIK